MSHSKSTIGISDLGRTFGELYEMSKQTTFSTIHVEPRHPAVRRETVIGLITPSNDTLTELELRRMMHDDSISFSAARIKHHEPSSIENLYRHVDEIAKVGELFDPPGAVKIFAYACTSGSAIISQEKLEAELRRARPGAFLTSPMTGALRAFNKLGVHRIAMLTPYMDEVGAVVTECLSKSGVSVCASASFHSKSDSDIAALSPESIFEAAGSFDAAEADALFIPCTLLRTSRIIDRLETRLGKPVITANQAMLWDALRLSKYGKPIEGYGQLLML